MFLRRFTDFTLQSYLTAMLVAFLIAFIPVIGNISIVIAALVTLRKGIVAGALVTVAATLPFLLSYASFSADETEMVKVAVAILIASNVLTWSFAGILRKYNFWNLTLEVAAVVGIVIVVAVHVIYPDIQTWWQSHLGAYLNKTTTLLGVDQDPEANAAQLEMLNTMKRYATGFVTASVLFNAMLQLILARWWQAALFNPGGLRKELYQIRLSYVAGILFILGLIGAYLGNDIVIDVMPILFLVFAAAGLSLLHNFAASMSYGWILLGFVYLAIIGLFPMGIVIVAFIALADTILNIRKRLNLTI